MADHTMPMLADSQREIHIDHCQKSLAAIDNNLEKFRKLDDAGTVILMLERERVVYAIALAELTSEPIAWLVSSPETGEFSFTPDEAMAKKADSNGYEVQPLYTTPPVPVVKPIELPEAFYGVIQGGKVTMQPAEDGQWLNRTQVNEAIRAAGYEVSE